MQNKEYFTPEIEDVCIGYECDIKYPTGWQKFIVKNTWFGKDGEGDFPEVFSCIENKIFNIRVPYLTKEQIEEEGFIYRGKVSHRTIPDEPFNKIELEFIKDNILIRFDVICNKIMIDKANNTRENVNFYSIKTLYHGECKCINQFRLIIKLLGI